MDFDPSQYVKLLAALLLIPGLLFLFVVVFYVAFIGKTAPAKTGAREETRTCLTCGRTLLPDQNECPTCMPQLIPLTPPVEMVEAPATEVEEVAFVEEEITPPPIDTSTAYEGEIVDDSEPPRDNA
jgi:hypothetical protein